MRASILFAVLAAVSARSVQAQACLTTCQQFNDFLADGNQASVSCVDLTGAGSMQNPDCQVKMPINAGGALQLAKSVTTLSVPGLLSFAAASRAAKTALKVGTLQAGVVDLANVPALTVSTGGKAGRLYSDNADLRRVALRNFVVGTAGGPVGVNNPDYVLFQTRSTLGQSSLSKVDLERTLITLGGSAGGLQRFDRVDLSHSQVRADAQLASLVFSRVNLNGVTFLPGSGAGFTGPRLSSDLAPLSAAQFTILTKAVLTQNDVATTGDLTLSLPTLKNISFDSKSLAGLDLSGRDVSGSSFIGSDLTNVDLRGATGIVDAAQFAGANFFGAKMCSQDIHKIFGSSAGSLAAQVALLAVQSGTTSGLCAGGTATSDNIVQVVQKALLTPPSDPDQNVAFHKAVRQIWDLGIAANVLQPDQAPGTAGQLDTGRQTKLLMALLRDWHFPGDDLDALRTQSDRLCELYDAASTALTKDLIVSLTPFYGIGRAAMADLAAIARAHSATITASDIAQAVDASPSCSGRTAPMLSAHELSAALYLRTLYLRQHETRSQAATYTYAAGYAAGAFNLPLLVAFAGVPPTASGELAVLLTADPEIQAALVQEWFDQTAQTLLGSDMAGAANWTKAYLEGREPVLASLWSNWGGQVGSATALDTLIRTIGDFHERDGLAATGFVFSDSSDLHTPANVPGAVAVLMASHRLASVAGLAESVRLRQAALLAIGAAVPAIPAPALEAAADLNGLAVGYYAAAKFANQLAYWAQENGNTAVPSLPSSVAATLLLLDEAKSATLYAPGSAAVTAVTQALQGVSKDLQTAMQVPTEQNSAGPSGADPRLQILTMAIAGDPIFFSTEDQLFGHTMGPSATGLLLDAANLPLLQSLKDGSFLAVAQTTGAAANGLRKRQLRLPGLTPQFTAPFAMTLDQNPNYAVKTNLPELFQEDANILAAHLILRACASLRLPDLQKPGLAASELIFVAPRASSRLGVLSDTAILSAATIALSDIPFEVLANADASQAVTTLAATINAVVPSTNPAAVAPGSVASLARALQDYGLHGGTPLPSDPGNFAALFQAFKDPGWLD